MVENTEEIGTTTLWLATQARVCKAAKFAVSESQRQFPSPCECLRTYFSEAGQLVTSCTLNFSGLDRLTPDMIPLIWRYLKHVEIPCFQQTLKRHFQWCWPRSNEPIASFFLAFFFPHDTVEYSWQNRFRHLLWIPDWFYCWQGTTEQWIPQCFHIRLVLYNSSKIKPGNAMLAMCRWMQTSIPGENINGEYGEVVHEKPIATIGLGSHWCVKPLKSVKACEDMWPDVGWTCSFWGHVKKTNSLWVLNVEPWPYFRWGLESLKISAISRRTPLCKYKGRPRAAASFGYKVAGRLAYISCKMVTIPVG